LLYTNLLNKFVFAALLWLMSGTLLAGQQEPTQSPQAQAVERQFAPLFTAITGQLSTDKQRYLSDPMAYQVFIDRTLRPLWDITSTTRALIGRSTFETLTSPQRESLVNAVGDTLTRYAFEGLENYSSQQFRIVDVVINQQGTMGWVQVLMESNLIPDIVLDVLIKQTSRENDIWHAVDVRFKGITYVSIKKHAFRETIEEQGIDGLITDLESKNDDYFAAICSKTNSSGRAPCAIVAN
jgi:ABC-type transporter MlaC component